MRRAFGLAGLLMLSAIGYGQPAGNPPGFVCTANVGQSVIARTEGITELVGDLLLQCTGGVPTPLGQVVPSFNISLSLNANVTSRLLNNNGYTEAVMMIDEPGSPANPTQLGCNVVPSCPVLGTGTGLGVYSGIPSQNGAPSRPNVYLGAMATANQVTWLGVPIDAPGTNGVRLVRITNVRANANQLGLSSTLIPTQVVGFISVTGSSSITINNPQQVLADIQAGLLVGVVPGSFQQCQDGFNNNQLFSEDVPGVAGPAVFRVRFKENVAKAFRQRQGTGAQNIPGQVYNTESSFIPNVSAGLPSGIGLANTGTLLRAVFNNVPNGVRLLVNTTVPLVDSSGAQAGTAVTASPGGVISGNNITVQGDSSGYANFYFQVTQRDSAKTGPLELNVPVTVTGAASTVLVHVGAVLSFANSQFPQTTLFAAGSPLVNSVPIDGPIDAGVSTPAEVPYLNVASIVACTNSGSTLNSNGNTAPSFIGTTGSGTGSPTGQVVALDAAAAAGPTPSLQSPRLSNVGIVSTLLPVNNIAVAKDADATWLNVGLSSTTTPATAILGVNAAAPGNYSTTLRFSAPNIATLQVPVTYKVTPGPWFTRYGFSNQASYVGNVVAPGEPFVIIGGDDFGPTTLTPAVLGADGRAVSLLGDTQVLFDGVAAPLYYSVNLSGIGVVTGFAPFSLANKINTTGTTDVQVVYKGVKSPPVTLFILDAVPGLYTANATGGGQGSIENHDLTINGADNPESVGSIVVIYGCGAGQTTPGGRDGAITGVGASVGTLNLSVRVFIDGIEATDIPYSGPAPGIVEGVFQVNARIPAGVRRNANVPVVVQIGDKQTQPGVTLATK